MRQHLALAVLLASSSALAEDMHKPIDIKPVIDKLDVYKDDVGNVLVTPKPLAIKDDAETWVFYGDGKTMYQQRIIATGVSGDKLDWGIWSPRVVGLPMAQVSNDPNGAEVRCRAGKPAQKLVPLPPDKAKAILSKGKFFPPLWERQSRFLARDDDGVYFFVDVLREDYGGKGHRVYVGKKGSMKQQTMTNIVSDSAGEIYATKAGDLKIISGTDGKAYWKKGAKTTELKQLDPQDNRYLIYRELGIYGTLGVVCDDQ